MFDSRMLFLVVLGLSIHTGKLNARCTNIKLSSYIFKGIHRNSTFLLLNYDNSPENFQNYSKGL